MSVSDFRQVFTSKAMIHYYLGSLSESVMSERKVQAGLDTDAQDALS